MTDGPADQRAGALIAVAAMALVGQRMSVAGDVSGAVGRLVHRLDLAAPLLVALAAAWAWNTSLPLRRRVLGVLLALFAWACVAAVALTVNPIDASARQLLPTVGLFRPLGAPIDTLEIGVVAHLAACAVLFVPLLRRWTAGTVVVALGLIGSLLRAALRSADNDPFGPHSLAPGALLWMAAGIAAVTLFGNASRRHQIVAGSAALAALIAAAALLPRTAWFASVVDDTLWSVLGAVVATGVIVAAQPSHLRGLDRYWRWAAWSAPGILLCGGFVGRLVARHYRERFVPPGTLNGRVLMPTVWTVLLAGALGVIATSAVLMATAARDGRIRHVALGAIGGASVLAIAFVVRVGALMTVSVERTDQGDPFFYHTTANALAAGRGFIEPFKWVAFGETIPTAFHGPVYPLVLSVSSRLGGTDYFDHKMTSITVGVAVVGSVMVLARMLAGAGAALVAGLAAALYPNLWQIDTLMYPEGIMALLVTWSVIVMYRWIRLPRMLTAAVIGALIALAALARGEAALLGPLMVMPVMLRRQDLTAAVRWRHLLLAGAACLAVLAPWMVRNALHFNRFVPLSNNGNEVLVYSNCEAAYNGRLLGYWDFGCQERIRAVTPDPPGDESDLAIYWRDIGLDYALDHAAQLPKVVTVRVLRQWELYRPLQNASLVSIEGRNVPAGQAALGMYYVMLALGVLGTVGLRRRGTAVWPLVAQVVSVTVTAAYTYGTIRFRAPFEPVLCAMAGVGALPALRVARGWMAGRPTDVDPPPFVLGGRRGLRLRRGTYWQRPAVRTWVALAAVGVAVAVPLRGLYHTTGGTMEEAFMIVFPERMWAGDLPNRDFLHLYGPGSLHVLMGWFKAFGYSLASERTFGLLQHLGIISALFTLARPWGRTAAASVGMVSVVYVLTPVGLTAMAWNGGLALVLWSTVMLLRAEHLAGPLVSRARLIAGVLAGLALTYRPDLALAIGALFVWYLFTVRPRPWKPLLVGGFAGLAPLWVHTTQVGPTAVVRGMFLDPVFELRPGRELPRPPSWSTLDGALQAIAELIPPWWRLPALTASQSLFVWFFAMLAAPPLMLATARVSRQRGAPPARTRTLTAAGLVALGVIPQALQRPDSTHLSWVTCVSFPLLVVVVAEWRSTGAAGEHRPNLRRASLIGLVTVVGLTLIVAPLFTFRYYLLHSRVAVGNVQRPFPTERNGRRFYFGDFNAAQASQQAIDELDQLLVPGQRLIVGPADLRRTWYSDANFYYQFPELVPGTYFIEMDPGLANAPDSPLADELRRADWVILTRFWDGWYEPNSAMEFGSDEPNLVIRTQYCLQGSYGEGLVELYRRCR